MQIVGVIPARYQSSRFPGKPLALICGKPLLQWVVEGAKTSKALSDLWVATDHEQIAALAKSLNVKVAMTSSQIATGTDRVWATVKDVICDVVVNIQGDEPLLSGTLLDEIVAPFAHDTTISMVTAGRDMSKDDLLSKNTAKIVVNQDNDAIYFSRFAIPHSRVDVAEHTGLNYSASLKHIGIYAYRKSFLKKFCEQVPVAIEESEGLEQLRALYLGGRIRVVKVAHESWGVDTPLDLIKIESLMKQKV